MSKAEQLTKQVCNHAVVADAMQKGIGQEITYDSMVHFYSSELAAKRGVPTVDTVMKPRVLRSSSGRAVTVNAWKPKPLDSKG